MGVCVVCDEHILMHNSSQLLGCYIGQSVQCMMELMVCHLGGLGMFVDSSRSI